MNLYEAPVVRELGSLADVTLSGLNKIGNSTDMYSSTTPLVGSVVSAP